MMVQAETGTTEKVETKYSRYRHRVARKVALLGELYQVFKKNQALLLNTDGALSDADLNTLNEVEKLVMEKAR